MRAPGGLVVYVTSHGFGHLNRSASVINRIPVDVPVFIRCHSNLFSHWQERLHRPADLSEHVSDAGAVNPVGDSAATDGAATLERAAIVHAEGLAGMDDEVQWLRKVGAAAVLSDAPPLPLVAAKKAGIPGFLLANFTWSEIYAQIREGEPPGEPGVLSVRREPCPPGIAQDDFVAEIRLAYRDAVEVFRAEPALELADFDRDKITDVGMVVTPGRDRRVELRKQLGIAPTSKLVYFYIGRYGQADLGWERLEALHAKEIHLVGFHHPPRGPLANFHVVRPEDWTGADLAASTDVIVAKAGYGTACEAMVAGTPMIYPPRTGFAEHSALDRALRNWGGGLPASAKEFAEMRIEHLLEDAFRRKPGPPPFPVDGAARIAERLTRVCQSSELREPR